MGWSDERIEKLKTLWAEGLSASQIAGRLGAVTRNAVISKVHRLGLARRETVSRARRSGGEKRACRVEAQRPKIGPWGKKESIPRAERETFAETDFKEIEALASDDVATKSMATIADNDCRWPVGDPKSSAFGFCGCEKVPGLPYCKAHVRRAFQKPTTIRKDGGTRAPTMLTQILLEDA